MARYLSHRASSDWGEVMDCRRAPAGTRYRDKLDLFRDKSIDGHAPGLTDRALCATRSPASRPTMSAATLNMPQGAPERPANPRAEEERRQNLEAIVSGLVREGMDTTGFSFCTDDKHIEEIRREGHISFCVKRPFRSGCRPSRPSDMATINAARCYGLRRLGAVAPRLSGRFCHPGR